MVVTIKLPEIIGITLFVVLIKQKTKFTFFLIALNTLLPFYNAIKILISNITQLPVNVSINELMNTSNYYINLQFMKYISACFDFRDELLAT